MRLFDNNNNNNKFIFFSSLGGLEVASVCRQNRTKHATLAKKVDKRVGGRSRDTAPRLVDLELLGSLVVRWDGWG